MSVIRLHPYDLFDIILARADACRGLIAYEIDGATYVADTSVPPSQSGSIMRQLAAESPAVFQRLTADRDAAGAVGGVN